MQIQTSSSPALLPAQPAKNATLLAAIFNLGPLWEQRPFPLDFAVSHDEERHNDNQPIDVVTNDGAVCRRVSPAEDGVEDAPTASTVHLWATTVDMPDRFVNIVGSRATTEFDGITSDGFGPLLTLQGPDRAREEAGCDEVEEGCREDEEELQLG